MAMQTRQQGGSGIGLIIFMAILGYVVFVGIQYVPQYVESNAVRTILDNLAEKNLVEPFNTMGAVQSAIDNQLFVNQMGDLKDSFKVTQYRGDFVVKVSYERELNLGYETKVMKYERSVTLD